MKALKSSFIYFFSAVIEKGLALLLIPIYTHYLSTEDYGIWTLAQVIIAFLSICFSLSLPGAAARFHFDGDNSYRSKLYGNIFFSVIYTSLIFSALFYFIKEPVFKLIGNLPVFPYFYLIIIIVFPTPSILLYNQKLQMEHRATRYGIQSVLKFLIVTSLSLYFVLVQNLKADGILGANAIGMSIIFLYVLYRFIKEKIRFKSDYSLIKKSINYSVWLVLNNTSAIIMKLIDRVFVTSMINLSTAGIYALGGQVTSILTLFNVAINRAATPDTLKAFKEKNYSYIINLANLIILFVAILAMWGSVLSVDIIKIIAPITYATAYKIIPFLFFSQVFQMYYFRTQGVLFYIVKATRFVSVATIVSALLNVILNIILIKKIGMIGASIATMISFMLTNYLVIYIANKYIKINFRHIKIHIIILFTFSISLINFIDNIIIFHKMLVLLISTIILIYYEKNNELLKNISNELIKSIPWKAMFKKNRNV